MAIYHVSTKPIARSAGRSAVAAAAYRAGAELADERTGLVHDYTRKGGVVRTEMVTPDGGSAERNALWNSAELAEKRKDSRTAREWIVALPAELNAEQRNDLARSFGVELATRYGVAVDIAIHRPDREGDNRNHHAHLLTTTRQVNRDPSGALVMGEKSTIELSDKKRRELGLGPAADEVMAIRQLWEQTANEALERAGRAERIDARSLKAQGIDREATTHLGPVATAMERRGLPSDRGDNNRQAEANNRKRAQLQARIMDLQAMVEQQRQEEQKRWEKARKEQEDRIAQRPEMIKAAWQAEQVRQFELIAAKAHRIHPRIAQHVERQKRTVTAHDQKRPKPPWGLFAGLRMTAYRQKLIAWRDHHAKLQNRLNQLENRLSLVDECMRRSAIPLYPTKGEQLATRKAATMRPDLAERLQQLREQERAALVAQLQARTAQRQTRPRGRGR